jgi:hypothetical protein
VVSDFKQKIWTEVYENRMLRRMCGPIRKKATEGWKNNVDCGSFIFQTLLFIW